MSNFTRVGVYSTSYTQIFCDKLTMKSSLVASQQKPYPAVG